MNEADAVYAVAPPHIGVQPASPPSLQRHDLAIIAGSADAVRRGAAALSARRPIEGARWFARAARLAPCDLATELLHAQAIAATDLSSALAAATDLAACHPSWQAVRLLLVSLLHAAAKPEAAAAELAACLRTAFCPTDSPFANLAARVCAAAGFPGWLGVSNNGQVFAAGATQVTLDGAGLHVSPAGGFMLPPHWRTAARVHANAIGRPLLGSPLDVQAILQHRGAMAETPDGALKGWVAATGDPATAPAPWLDFFDAATSRHLLRLDTADHAAASPYPWANGFRIAPSHLPECRVLRIFPCDPMLPVPATAHDLPQAFELAGSALHRGSAAAACTAMAFAAHIAIPTSPAPARPRAAGVPPLFDLIIDAPGHRVPPGASGVQLPPDADFAARFNAALHATNPGRDVLLLHPAINVAPETLARLARAATLQPRTATLSAMHGGTGPAAFTRPGFALETLQRALRNAAKSHIHGIALPDGPCIYFRRAALADVGPLREVSFGETTGALADFAARANARNWRHHVATDILIGAGTSVTTETADWLHPARHAADRALWALGRRKKSVILVTHAEGGGIERHIQARAAASRAAGSRPIFLRATATGCEVSEPGSPALPDLVFIVPDALESLAALLRADNPSHVEFHHAASHHQAIESLPVLLGIPYDVVIHDYAPVCPRVTLTGGSGKYCGEPADARDCQDCLADHGARVPNATDITAWRARSAALLAAAREVRAPSEDTARRITRHFAAVRPQIVPWIDDCGIVPPRYPTRRSAGFLHVAVLGALTQEKGFDVLLASARDAARRALKLRFTLIGHSIGDSRLIDTGHVFVTGPFAEGQGPDLLAETDADIALLPAVWPETWSYALSDLWRAGLWVVAFDLGAPAARIRAGGGGTLLPPGLPPARLNDSLLALLFRAAAPASPAVRRHV